MKNSGLPKHVAIIMDGNRRWARGKGLSAIGGHNYVVDEVVEPIIQRCGELGISYLTLWAFSTENWKRDKKEVDGLMQLFRKALMTKVEGFIKKGARLRMIGDIEKFPVDVREGMVKAMEDSKQNTKITVTFALNYGGRDEVIRALNRYLSMPNFSGKINEEQIDGILDTANMPDPDLIIRTGGEKRLSGFMMWQSVYSELYFTDTLMPEFTTSELDRALEDYLSRERRFGK